MTSVTTKTFRSGNSEAVRLPKGIAYGRDIELEATRSGDTIILQPSKKRRTPSETVSLLRAMPRPTYIQDRDPFDWPERA